MARDGTAAVLMNPHKERSKKVNQIKVVQSAFLYFLLNRQLHKEAGLIKVDLSVSYQADTGPAWLSDL